MNPGFKLATGETMPKTISPFNLSHETFKDSKVHVISLKPGDCLYVPPYWWTQIQSSDEEVSIGVTFWYECSSSWLELFMKGVHSNLL